MHQHAHMLLDHQLHDVISTGQNFMKQSLFRSIVIGYPSRYNLTLVIDYVYRIVSSVLIKL